MKLFRKKKKNTPAPISPLGDFSKAVIEISTDEIPTEEIASPAALSTETAATMEVKNSNADPDDDDDDYDDCGDKGTAKLYADAKILHKEFPTATYEECIRMRTLRTLKSARKNLNAYMEWRETYRMEELISDSPSLEDDSQVWDYAVKHALSVYPGSPPGGLELDKKLPRYVRIIGDEPSKQSVKKQIIDGNKSAFEKRTLYFIIGLIDVKIASLDVYALAFAMYFYLVMPRDSLEYVNILVDNRPGERWANPSASTLYPMARKLQFHMNHFPQRLRKLYAYPVPLAAQLLWSLCKNFLRPKVVEKINIYWGHDFEVVPAKWNFDEATMEKIGIERRSEL